MKTLATRVTFATIVAVFVMVGVGIWLFSRSSSTFVPQNGGPTQLTAVTLRLPIPVVDTGLSPFYLAIDKGMFAKYGLDVTLEPGSAQLNPIQTVSQGTDTFGLIGGPELLLSARARGASVVAVSLLHKDSDFVVLLTLSESGLVDLQQLSGKRVGMFYGHISTDILRMLFRKEGVSVEEVDVGFDYSQLLSGRVDAQWAIRSTAGINLMERGIDLNFISPVDYGIHTDGLLLIVAEDTLRERAEVVQAFVSALIEGLEYSVANPEEAIASAVRRDPTFSRDIGRRQMEIYDEVVRRNLKPGWISIEEIRRAAEQMQQYGELADMSVLERAVDSRFVEQHYERWGP